MKTKSIALMETKVLAKAGLFAIFLAVSIFAPFLRNQFITGPIVNALLFLSTAFLGIPAGILLGFLPSVFARIIGLLPAPLLPMIPYIIISNIILVLSFGILRKKSFWPAVFVSSGLKFLFLFLASSLIINFFFKNGLSSKIASMMSWPQLATALFGGVIAFMVFSVLGLLPKK